MWKTSDVLMGSSGHRSVPEGSCTWQYDGSEWKLLQVDAKNGGVPGEPPLEAGKFVGHLRVTPCVAP